MPEPPYGEIWDLLKNGKVVPFLGAGASLAGRPQNVKWDADQPTFLPNGSDLAHFLADKSSFPSADPHDRDDLAKVSSYFTEISGRRRLRDRLRQVLAGDYPSGPLHNLLAAVPAHQVIVVTNYDSLVEQAFKAANKPYDLVIHPADRKDIANAILWWPHGEAEPKVKTPNELDIDLGETTVIYKMHGTLFRDTDKWDNFVITEEDYIEFLSRMTTNTAVPSLFYEYFRDRSFLFLGYSLRDWNLRVVLKNLSKPLASRSAVAGADQDEPLPSWAIQHDPSELEQTLWRRRGVHIFDVTLDEFVAKLQREM
jgi:hypothetical protein